MKEDGEWSMIQPSLHLLDMCFPYGLQAEEERGRGRRVNLVVTPLEGCDDCLVPPGSLPCLTCDVEED